MVWIIALLILPLKSKLNPSLQDTRKHNKDLQIYSKTRLNPLKPMVFYHINYENSQIVYKIPIVLVWHLGSSFFRLHKGQLRAFCHQYRGSRHCSIPEGLAVPPKMTKALEKIQIPQDNYPITSLSKPLWYRCCSRSALRWQNWQIEKLIIAAKQKQSHYKLLRLSS